MEQHPAFSREYWRVAGTICMLSESDGKLEVVLRDDEGLIALQPCSDYFEASALAYEWRTHPPPRWPREDCLA